jgi:isopentenyldiphosphate isomerase
MAGRIAVVDQENRFVRWEERRVIHERRLVHRSIHILVYDRAGRLVVQRRHRDKQTYPGYWDCSTSGHVEESDYTGHPDEDLAAVYLAVARRELMEELGVEAPLELLAHLPPDPKLHYEQIYLYRAVSDGPFTAQPEEVEEIRAVTEGELRALSEDPAERVTPLLLYLVAWLKTREGDR